MRYIGMVSSTDTDKNIKTRSYLTYIAVKAN
jgi:hypothetical protein